MNNRIMWVLVVVALLVGAFGGYYYEKSKLMKQVAMVQSELDSAKMKSDEAMKKTTSEMAPELIMMAKGTGVVTDAKGMTLYIFDKDTKNVSSCTGTCLANWPAFLVNGQAPASLPENLGTFKRTDGTMQYSWKGMPLYYFAGDKKAGDTAGDGVGGVWHVAK